jgi:hypothetical protein
VLLSQSILIIAQAAHLRNRSVTPPIACACVNRNSCALLSWQEEEGEGFKPVTSGFRLEGCKGGLVAHVGYARERGKACAVVCLAAAEAFPEGLLEGAVFHWGVASREGSPWAPPPEGWQSDPAQTLDTGGAELAVMQCVHFTSCTRRAVARVHAQMALRCCHCACVCAVHASHA